MEIRLEKLHRMTLMLMGGKNEKPRRGVLKRNTSGIVTVCLEEIISWRAK